MASLIHQIDSITAARYGVNILEQRPPGEVQGESANVVCSVGDFPWGPVDSVTLITSPAEFFDLFAPGAFGRLDQDYPALLSYINKTFPSAMKVVRTANTGAASSAGTFDDGAATASVDVAARYPGAKGNEIEIEWIANATDPSARDMRIKVGAYDRTYSNVVTAALVTTDPGDPFVTVAANVAQVDVPAVAALAALTGGLDGSPAIGDYLGTPGVGRGLEEFAAAGEDADVIFGAEIPQPLVAGWNAGLLAFQEANEKGMAILSTDSAITTKAGAIADVVAYRKDRQVYPWPRVQTVNTYDPDRATVVVDGASFAAVAVASVPPEVSPGGAPGAPFLSGITGLDPAAETINSTGYKALNDAGIAPFFNSTALQGFIIHRGFTTSLVSGEERIFRRRMADFIMGSIAASAETFVGSLLDLDLPNKALGPNTSVQAGMWRQFLDGLVEDNRIRGYDLDAFGSNLQANIDAGQWRVAISVKLISAQEELIFLATIGERVELAAA